VPADAGSAETEVEGDVVTAAEVEVVTAWKDGVAAVALMDAAVEGAETVCRVIETELERGVVVLVVAGEALTVVG